MPRLPTSTDTGGKIIRWLSSVAVLTYAYSAFPHTIVTSSLNFVWMVVIAALDMPYYDVLWGRSGSGVKAAGVIVGAALVTWPVLLRSSRGVTLIASLLIVLPFLPCEPFGQLRCHREGLLLHAYFGALVILWTTFWLRERFDNRLECSHRSGHFISHVTYDILYGMVLGGIILAISPIAILVGFPLALFG